MSRSLGAGGAFDRSREVHFDVVIDHTCYVGLDRSDGGKADHPARCNIEPGTVSWAFDLAPIERALVQGAAVVGALIVDRVEAVTRVAHRDSQAIDVERASVA